MDTWILLRGLTREARHWGDFPNLLEQALPGSRVHAIDSPGNGLLCHETSPTSVAAMMERARITLRNQGFAPPYHLLSLSLGSMIATAWATTYPQEIARSVLMNTSLRPYCPIHLRLRPRNLPALLLRLVTGDDMAMERTILRLTSSTADMGVLPFWVDVRRQCPVSRRNALRQLLAAGRYQVTPGAPPVPTLLLSGARDQLVDPRCSARIASAWGVPLRTHPQAGHDLPLDDGPWVAAQIKEWI
jgi:pimeloyl-ACP methyl ester carboxylesterase